MTMLIHSAGDRVFDLLSSLLIILTIVACLLVRAYPLPALEQREFERSPSHYVELLLEAPEPVVKAPVPEPVVEEIPEPKPQPEPPKEAIVAPAPQTVKQAKEKAKTAGLLAFADELADMRNMIDVASLQDTAAIQRGTGDAAQLDRSLITSGKATRQASVNLTSLSRETGGVALSGRQTTVVQAIEQQNVPTGAVRLVTPETLSVRSIEEVRKVFDANKGAIYAIYNRALRQIPGLAGKVIFDLLISPDGSVAECSISSSEMQDATLTAKLVNRIRLFDFGARAVAETRITYPVHFLPR